MTRRRSRLVAAGVVVFLLGFAALATAVTLESLRGRSVLPAILGAVGGALLVGGAVLLGEGVPL